MTTITTQRRLDATRTKAHAAWNAVYSLRSITPEPGRQAAQIEEIRSILADASAMLDGLTTSQEG